MPNLSNYILEFLISIVSGVIVVILGSLIIPRFVMKSNEKRILNDYKQRLKNIHDITLRAKNNLIKNPESMGENYKEVENDILLLKSNDFPLHGKLNKYLKNDPLDFGKSLKNIYDEIIKDEYKKYYYDDKKN